MGASPGEPAVDLTPRPEVQHLVRRVDGRELEDEDEAVTDLSGFTKAEQERWEDLLSYVTPEECTRIVLAERGDAEDRGEPAGDGYRQLVLTRASDIKPRRVRWLWDGRLALGMLALLAGREGLGKSILGYWLAAMITRGELPR